MYLEVYVQCTRNQEDPNQRREKVHQLLPLLCSANRSRRANNQKMNPPSSCVRSADHSNRINKAIHLICIWPILWTTLALATCCSFGKLPPGVLEFLPVREDAWNIHAGTPVVLIYIVVYLGETRF